MLRDSENRLMGVCLVSRQTPTETLGHVGILDLFVHPNYTPHLDRLLIKTLSKAKKELEVKNVLMYVEEDNTHVIDALTERKFVKTACLPGYFKDMETLVNVFVFRRDLRRESS